MMLLTLVENAIKHRARPMPEGGTVNVSAATKDGELQVRVADSGRGFAKSSGGGTGLANIRARLSGMYGLRRPPGALGERAARRRRVDRGSAVDDGARVRGRRMSYATMNDRSHSLFRHAVVNASATVLLAATPVPAWSQDDTEPVVKLERVEVTGSHIPRTEIETALPVQVITREEIERSGSTTVAEVMAKVSANIVGFNDQLSIGNFGEPGSVERQPARHRRAARRWCC